MPFLKGMHQTLDSWRPNRDVDGWVHTARLESEGYWDAATDRWVSYTTVEAAAPPLTVTPVPRLQTDISSLQRLLSATTPPVRYLRSSKVQVAAYGFVDASRVGFGGSIQLPNGITATLHGNGREPEASGGACFWLADDSAGYRRAVPR